MNENRNPALNPGRNRLAWLLSFALLLPAPQAFCAVAPVATPLGALSQGLRAPASVAGDAVGNCYVTEPAAGQVVILDAFGRVAAVRPGFARPLAIAVDSMGRIYLSEEQKGSVSVFDAQGHLLYKLGQGEGEFILPSHIAVEAGPGRTYVCDSKANQVKIYQGSQLVQTFGGYGTLAGRFDFPAGVYVSPSSEVFVVDQNNDRVQVFDRNGAFKRLFALGSSDGSASLGPSRSGRSQGVSGDASGRIYVADAFQSFVRVFDEQGNFLATVGSYGRGTGQLSSPSSLAVAPNGQLWVASANNGRVEVFGLDAFVQLNATPNLQVVPAGTNVSFSVTLSGTGPFAYQWRKNSSRLTDCLNVSGASTPQLSLTAVSTNDSGAFSVVVTSAAGTFTSPGAVLTVLTPPSLLSQPANQTVLAGSPASFSVAAQGDALGLQWLFNGLPIPGATNAVLSIPSVQAADGGGYSVLVANPVGQVASASAVLAVITPPSAPLIDSLALQPDNTAQLFFRVDAGYSYTLEVSEDLQIWTTLTNLFGDTGGIEFADAGAAAHPLRFYRLRWAP
jgi:DNA-binding beta-propeller fold protein YncE